MTYLHQRLLSHTEIESALTCMARWDFSYGGHLTGGDTLKPRETAPILTSGRAWGAAVAKYHTTLGPLAVWEAHTALREALDRDAREMEKRSALLPSQEARVAQEAELGAMLDHYVSVADRFPADLTLLEGELNVPVPSRGASGRASGLYRFQAFLDAFYGVSAEEWVVEFKLRGRLTDPALVVRQRQPRWYAWSYAQKTGRIPTGVVVEERLYRAPDEPRLVRGGTRPSHDKAQLTTAEKYIDVCHAFSEEPHLEVVEALRGRMWQQRIPIMFRPGEIEAAGREVRDAAKLIRDLDHGHLTPIRNAQPAHCNRCRFNAICNEPYDRLLVDTMFERTVPKRLREPIQEVVPA